MSVPLPSARAIGVAAALAFAAAHALAVSREGVNWDEFALLWRAAETLRQGNLLGGGRPGLGVMVLLPFVGGCEDVLHVVAQARWLWAGFTFAILAGLFALVREALDRRDDEAAAAAVGLLALVPVFLRWTLQVRTDQPAVAFALWGGVMLLRARAGWAWAGGAGALFAVGFLFSQKAAYVGLVALTLLVSRELEAPRWRSWWAPAVAFAAAAAAIFAAYGALVTWMFGALRLPSVRGSLEALDLYRSLFGYRAYVAMLPTLLPHLLLLGLLPWALWRARRGETRPRRSLLGAAAALLVAMAVVGRFHGSAFPYFWITLGLFPSVALALVFAFVRDTVAPRFHRLLRIGLWGMLGASAVPASLGLVLADSQAIQRRSLAFVARHFAPTDFGFQAEGALLCRADPQPMPIYFTSTIRRLWQDPEAIARLLAEFRQRPVKFMLAHRFAPFPPAVREYWNQNYVPYRDEVLVPGKQVAGEAGAVLGLEFPIPGRYRWLGDATLEVDGVPLAPTGDVEMRAGTRQVRFVTAGQGALVWSVSEPPAPSREPFYARAAVLELDPPG